MKKLAVLGSTGSIGVNVLDVVRRFPDRYTIVALAAGGNIRRLAEQIAEFKPSLVSVRDDDCRSELQALLPASETCLVFCGSDGNVQAAVHQEADLTVSAMVGALGLLPTLAAIEAGKDIGLANKETLVMAGHLVMEAVRRRGVRLLPIDSEHSAIFQALEAGRRSDLRKIILTASGGPFRALRGEQLARVTAAEALRHPNWSMGKKITIDSATLMNKGLEVIEARWLFDVAPEEIEVVIHPQSIVHSLVEYRDGSVLAQMGLPDMRIPIAYALSYPERLPLPLPRLDLTTCGELQFLPPDHENFPALGLAFSALKRGGTVPAVLNGANEVAVEAFLAGRIAFPQIAETVAATMDNVGREGNASLDEILAADALARSTAERLLRL
jgi:1-deoxy-D-xylulose-5-phosphate reductoisomerase